MQQYPVLLKWIPNKFRKKQKHMWRFLCDDSTRHPSGLTWGPWTDSLRPALLRDVVLHNVLAWLLQVIAPASMCRLGQWAHFFLAFHFNFVPPALESLGGLHSSLSLLLCSFQTAVEERAWCHPTHFNRLLHSFWLQVTSSKCTNCTLFALLSVVTAWMLTLLSWQCCGVPVCVSVKVIINL